MIGRDCNAMLDVVYLIKEDPENNTEELRYSLRSLRNIPHGKVVIVGEKPGWVTNVLHIPVPQSGTKAQNVASNLAAAVDSRDITEEFLLMNDDFFIMRLMPDVPILNFGDMKRVIADYERRYPEGSDYISKMKRLYRALLDRGCDHPVSYELHIPMTVKKERIQSMRREIGSSPIYQFRTFYGNYWRIGGEATEDVKVFLQPQHNSSRYNNDPYGYMKTQDFLSATGGAFRRGLVGDYIRSAFPERSIYEAS